MVSLVRPDLLYGWHGPSLLVVTTRGACGPEEPLSGFFYREARHLRTLCMTVNGQRPWLCEASALSSRFVCFNYVHPERMEFGGGGSDQAVGDDSVDEYGVSWRSLVLELRLLVEIASLRVMTRITNHGLQPVDVRVEWRLEADFADTAEALAGTHRVESPVEAIPNAGSLLFSQVNSRLTYRTRVTGSGACDWAARPDRLTARVRIGSQQTIALALLVEPDDGDIPEAAERDRREEAWRGWKASLTSVEAPGHTAITDIVRHNVSDLASLPLLEGESDEWLTPQAGIPLYPARFGRDILTGGWQAAFLDSGEMLEAGLTWLGRMQTSRTDAWHDEEPGRIPHEVRTGPLARLGRHPRDAYYGDYAGPLMFVIALAHRYAWTGDKPGLLRHWDSARRALDWAREFGDLDGDGYLEYRSRSSDGLQNQGWKDSGRAILYDDGRTVPAPIGTCELQGYWFAAQQLAAVLCWALGERDTARAYWHGAMDLKERFNRDWWSDEGGLVAMAMDSDKRLIESPSSNAGHCIAAGIVSDAHLPLVVERLFQPDLFSGWGIRTLASSHAAYHPTSYHLGSVWPVEQATIAFGLRRFGFDTRAVELAKALFDLAALYPGFRIPECVGGFARSERPTPGAYPRANAPQLWNATAFPLLIHTLLGLQPVAPLDLLVVDPVLPDWAPEIVLRDLRLAGASATIRFWRDSGGHSHAEVLAKRGTLHLVRQPPPESLTAGAIDRFAALADRLFHH